MGLPKSVKISETLKHLETGIEGMLYVFFLRHWGAPYSDEFITNELV